MSNENSNIETLTQLVDLTKTFKAAAENPGYFAKRKIKKAITTDEKTSLVFGVMGGMLSGLFGASAPTEESLKKELKTAEIYAAVVQRALSGRKIAKLVPANQRTAENAQAFKEAGFPKLASLYTPKA